ncbi:MAG: ATP-binding cassette domain-containing protein [Microgenomates group bacterium]
MNVLFKNVTKHFGSIIALQDINFEVKSGDFVFIVGPSGAGKSTLLKIILTQYFPSSGQVYFDGHLMDYQNKSLVDKLRQNIGVIFQDYQLIADKTIEENIALALDINGISATEIPSKVDKAIDSVFLQTRRHLFPSQLSGGELQRAALARALAIDPKLILADEPTGNLDPENSWNLIKLLKDINEKRGTTIIMTTHNFDIVESLNKRKISMKNSSIVHDTQVARVKKIKKRRLTQ